MPIPLAVPRGAIYVLSLSVPPSTPAVVDIDNVDISVQAPVPADLNGDGCVNVSDLLLLIGAWGPCAGCSADINNDGVVNVSDLLLLIGAWGCG